MANKDELNWFNAFF